MKIIIKRTAGPTVYNDPIYTYSFHSTKFPSSKYKYLYIKTVEHLIKMNNI